jgi:hypothetical protein
MPRINPRVEQLERENSILRRILDENKKDPGDLPCRGCGDHSCVVRSPSGMGTNGGCGCSDRELRRALMWYKRRASFLEETIKQMVDSQTNEP